ncbi:uncharacterized protein LOC134275021 [Saccostrea cucullata]|uniref:uncharacterized protein LOC134275021 n=1 Tax=Saccostrea cuccullata TaxID=36930 RepID=UPI002ED21BEC
MELRHLINKTGCDGESTSGSVRGTMFIGFTLALTSQNFAHKGSILKFEEIITDYSAKFNDRGEFLCGLNGTYAFFLHLVTRSSNANGAWIYKNNSPMTLVWQGGPRGTPGDASGSTSIVVDLYNGDTMSIRSYKDNLTVTDKTVWSGHLLSKLPNDNPVLVTTLENPVAGKDVTIRGRDILVNLRHANFSMAKDNFLCTKAGLYKVDIHSIMKSSVYNSVELFYNGKGLDKNLYRSVTWNSQIDYSSSSTAAVLSLSSLDTLSLKMRLQNDRTLSSSSIFAVYFLKNKAGKADFFCKSLETIGTYLTCPKSLNIFSPTGLFSIKSKGFYYFGIHLVSATRDTGVRIYKNEAPMTTAWLGAEWGTWMTASTSIVVDMDLGDHITFRKITSGLNVDHASIITGYKIDI